MKQRQLVEHEPPKRCPTTGRDASVAWLECLIATNFYTVVELYFLWDALRAHPKLRRYRKRMRQKAIA